MGLYRGSLKGSRRVLEELCTDSAVGLSISEFGLLRLVAAGAWRRALFLLRTCGGVWGFR